MDELMMKLLSRKLNLWFRWMRTSILLMDM